MKINNPFYVAPVPQSNAEKAIALKLEIENYLSHARDKETIEFKDLRASIPSIAHLDDQALADFLQDGQHDAVIIKEKLAGKPAVYKKFSFVVDDE